MENLVNLPKLPAFGSTKKMSKLAKREYRNAIIFLIPWIIGFLGFTLIPMVATLLFTFMDLRITKGILTAPQWVGLANYITLFKDSQVWNMAAKSSPGSLWITFRFGIIALPVGILLPLGIALLMNNRHLKAQNFFRSMFYMPYIIPFVAAIFLWGGMLNPESGWINRFLLSIGVPKASTPNWVNDMNWIYPSYVIMGIWGIGNAMLTMLAGIQGVPSDLYDASRVDGAGNFATFWNVTLPMISPVIFYNLVLSIVGLFQYFLVPLVLNQGTGAPGGASMFYNLYLYKTFFVYQNMAYGSTLAWMLFVVILITTVVLFSTARYWVYYASDNP